MAIQYPSIPSPTADPAALYQSVLALKGTVDTLTGGIGSGDAAVVTSAGAAATAASVAAASAASAASVAASIAAIIQVSYKIVTFTRLLSLATGTQSITGVGFTPRLIQFQVGILDNSATGGWASAGESDGVSNYCLEFWPGGAQTFLLGIAGIQRDNASNYQELSVASMDADGFTLSWARVNAPVATATIVATCYK